MTQANKDKHTILMLEARIKSLEEEVIKYKFDHLTGLPVRIDFEPMFETFMHDCNLFQKSFVLAIVDINNLHNINEDDGYLVGDSIIISVGNALTHVLHDSNVFRIGGDEFAILSRTETVETIYKKLENNSNIESQITVGAAHSFGIEACSMMFSDVDRLMKSKKNKGRKKITTSQGQINEILNRIIINLNSSFWCLYTKKLHQSERYVCKTISYLPLTKFLYRYYTYPYRIYLI